MLSEERRREIAREYIKVNVLLGRQFVLVRRYNSMFGKTSRAFTIDPLFSPIEEEKLFIAVGESKEEVLEIIREENPNAKFVIEDVIEFKKRYIGISF